MHYSWSIGSKKNVFASTSGVLLIASLLFALFFCLESHAESSVCEVLDPDGSYVSEMLVEPSSLGLASGARYQRRVALVVGNSQYSFVSKLKNPTNDASAMARLLQALGFTVFKGVDLDAASLTACVEAYVQALDREPTSLSAFYYAGHGVQLQSSSDGDKRNYMLATDALVDASGKGRGFQQIDPILSQMRSRSEQAVFFYDACRSDPLGERAPLDVNGEKIKRQALIGGAAAIEVDEGSVSDQAELYIAYATAPNMVADDAYEQNAEHSPFTFALLRHLGTPGYSLQRVMSGVSSDVGDLTDWNQTPWTSSSLTRDVHLNGSLTFAQLSERSDALARESDVLLAEGRRYDALKTALMGLPANRALADDQAFHKAKAAAVAAFNAPVNVVKRHGDYISSVDLSPDGKTILSASHDGVVMLTDYDSGKLLLTLKGHDAAVMHASFNEDATKAASIDVNNEIIIWDIADGDDEVRFNMSDILYYPGTSLMRWPGTSSPLSNYADSISFVSGRDLIVVVYNNVWYTIDIKNERAQFPPIERPTDGYLAGSALQVRGTLFASASSQAGLVDIFDTVDGTKVHSTRIRGAVSSIAFLNGTTQIAINHCKAGVLDTETCRLALWDYESGEVREIYFPIKAYRLIHAQEAGQVFGFSSELFSSAPLSVTLDLETSSSRSGLPRVLNLYAGGNQNGFDVSNDGTHKVLVTKSVAQEYSLTTFISKVKLVDSIDLNQDVYKTVSLPDRRELLHLNRGDDGSWFLNLTDGASHAVVRSMDLTTSGKLVDFVISKNGRVVVMWFSTGGIRVVEVEKNSLNIQNVELPESMQATIWLTGASLSVDAKGNKAVARWSKGFAIIDLESFKVTDHLKYYPAEDSIVLGEIAEKVFSLTRHDEIMEPDHLSSINFTGFDIDGNFVFVGSGSVQAPYHIFYCQVSHSTCLPMDSVGDLQTRYQQSYLPVKFSMSEDREYIVAKIDGERADIWKLPALEYAGFVNVDSPLLISEALGEVISLDSTGNLLEGVNITDGTVNWQVNAEYVSTRFKYDDGELTLNSFVNIDKATGVMYLSDYRNREYVITVNLTALRALKRESMLADLSTDDKLELEKTAFRFWSH